MSILITAIAGFLSFSQGGNGCHCSKVNDFKTTTEAAFVAGPYRHLIVEADVVEVPDVHPQYGYLTTDAVVLNILSVETPDQSVPGVVTLKFLWPGECDPNPKLFTKDRRYLMLLERTSDPRVPFQYPGTACDIGMREVEKPQELSTGSSNGSPANTENAEEIVTGFDATAKSYGKKTEAAVVTPATMAPSSKGTLAPQRLIDYAKFLELY